MYVTQDDVVVDVIADSRRERVDVFFDPDAAWLKQGRSRTRHVKTDDVGLYRLQFINCDAQQTASIDIMVHDTSPLKNRAKRRQTIKRR